MLMSASSNEAITIRERLFDASPVTPAVRVNARAASLEPLYMAVNLCALIPLSEHMVMIRPYDLSFMDGNTACMPQNTAE